MSLYDGLTLVVSSVGTLGTVYIGLRQLRQNSPSRVPVHGQSTPQDPAPHLLAPHGPFRQPPAAALRRPSSVTAASLLLFIAAATHPLMVVLYYSIRFATAPAGAVAELRDAGVVDVLAFGGAAFLTALLGVFVARGARAGLWGVWVLGALALVLLCVTATANALAVMSPELAGVFALDALDVLILGYVVLVAIAYALGAALLAAARSRAFFRPA